jgi:hypothetical protein
MCDCPVQIPRRATPRDHHGSALHESDVHGIERGMAAGRAGRRLASGGDERSSCAVPMRISETLRLRRMHHVERIAAALAERAQPEYPGERVRARTRAGESTSPACTESIAGLRCEGGAVRVRSKLSYGSAFRPA